MRVAGSGEEGFKEVERQTNPLTAQRARPYPEIGSHIPRTCDYIIPFNPLIVEPRGPASIRPSHSLTSRMNHSAVRLGCEIWAASVAG